MMLMLWDLCCSPSTRKTLARLFFSGPAPRRERVCHVAQIAMQSAVMREERDMAVTAAVVRGE